MTSSDNQKPTIKYVKMNWYMRWQIKRLAKKMRPALESLAKK